MGNSYKKERGRDSRRRGKTGKTIEKHEKNILDLDKGGWDDVSKGEGVQKEVKLVYSQGKINFYGWEGVGVGKNRGGGI